MASSPTEICNMALSHLGVGKEIASLTEASQEAAACNRFYEQTLDEMLRVFNWGFATKIIAAELVEQDPNEEWTFAYRYPTDCLNVRRVLSGSRNDHRQSRVPYKISSSDEGGLIFTDLEEAEIEYTFRQTNPQYYTPGFTMAFSYLLAARIAPRVTGGDPFKLQQAALQMYDMTLSQEKARTANEEQPDEVQESEFIRARS